MNAKIAVIVLGLLLIGVVFYVREDEGPVERMGRQIDETSESVADSLEDAGDTIEDEADEMKARIRNQ